MNAAEREAEIARLRREEREDRLWCHSRWEPFTVYKVPTVALALNIDNRRFAAERKLIESQLGRALDPENVPEDEKAVIAILLDKNLQVRNGEVRSQPSTDYLELRRDWEGRGQASPFWIRPDGTVRNGNRRLAMVKRLREETGSDAHDWVDAFIFTVDDVDEGELFKMEQREQQTEDFKVRYTDINLLLSIRAAAELHDIDWTDPDDLDRVAGELQQVAGGDKNYALIQLQAIKYMDLYLEDDQAPGEYQRLLRQVERFRDVGKIMSKVEADYPDDQVEVLRVLFAAVRAASPHGEIRLLGKMFREDRDRFMGLLANVEEAESTWQEDATGLEDPDLTESTAEPEEDGEEEAPGPNVPDYPKDDVQTLVENSIDAMKTALDTDVASILEQAKNRLEPLLDERRLLANALQSEDAEAVRELLTAVLNWAEQARELAE